LKKKYRTTLNDSVADGKITKGQAITEIKNQLRRKKEQQSVIDWLKSNQSDSRGPDEILKNSDKSEADISGGCLEEVLQDYQGDGTEWVYERDKDGTIYKRMIGSGKRESVK